MRSYAIIFAVTAVLIFLSGSAAPLLTQTGIASQSEKKTPALQDTTLAAEYFDKGKALAKAVKYDSSNAYFEMAREIYEKLGEQHELETLREKTLQCSNNIGWIMILSGKYEAARVYLDQALESGSKRFGENHPDIAQSYNNIGIVHWYKGDYDRAMEYHQSSLSIRLRLLGESKLC